MFILLPPPSVKPLREEEEEEEDSLAALHSNRGKEEEGGRRQHYGAHSTVPLLTSVGIAALPPSPKSKWCFLRTKISCNFREKNPCAHKIIKDMTPVKRLAF